MTAVRGILSPTDPPVDRSAAEGPGLIETLWHEHQATQFPKAACGREVAGYDLIDLDYATAGCISTFLSHGTLDTWRLAVLALCCLGLGSVVSQLEGEERAYFSRLETIAGLALEGVPVGNQPS